MKVSNQDVRLFKTALKQARNSAVSFKHGAIIVSGGRILSTGKNKYGSHRISRMYYPRHKKATIHAELQAVLNVHNSELLKGSTLYSARIGRGRNTATMISTPCPSCIEVMKAFGIRDVVFHDGRKLVKQRV